MNLVDDRIARLEARTRVLSIALQVTLRQIGDALPGADAAIVASIGRLAEAATETGSHLDAAVAEQLIADYAALIEP